MDKLAKVLGWTGSILSAGALNVMIFFIVDEKYGFICGVVFSCFILGIFAGAIKLIKEN